MIKTWVQDQLHEIIGSSDDSIVDFCISMAQSAKNVTELDKLFQKMGDLEPSQSHEFAQKLFAKVHQDTSNISNSTSSTSHPIKRKRSYDSGSENDDEGDFNGINMQELWTAEPNTEKDTETKLVQSESKDAAIPPAVDTVELRTLARQRYLGKREEEKLYLLEKEVEALEDDVKKYGWDGLSSREQQQLTFKRNILQLARERRAIQQDQEKPGYVMPEDYMTEEGKIDINKRGAVLSKKYTLNDSLDWEGQQLERALDSSKQAKEGPDASVQDDEYDYVFDPSLSINFTGDFTNEGAIDDDEPKLTPQQRLLRLRIDQEEKRVKSIENTRKSLPVYEHREGLLSAVKEHQVLIVVGETGSGKTTQLPQYLYESGYCRNDLRIACTQPRRVAAMSVAARVAEEFGCRLGQEVGYSVRFEEKSSDKTVLKYMTDGMLVREFLRDPELAQYSVIMIDEAHERTLHTDILLGLVKDIARARPELRVIISSATMNAHKFSTFFNNAPIYNVPGRRFNVDIYYTLQPEANYIHASITTVFQIHLSRGPGDILVFLTGQDEIEATAESLTTTGHQLGKNVPELVVCPVYANMPPELQNKIFEPTPPGARKVVLATNIAETSITIDGIVYVIDCGLVKQNSYNPRSGMENLSVVACSRASADQRAGRAGRTGPGKCFRLYTKWAYYNDLGADTMPEMLRSNLASIVLLLMSLGIRDVLHFDFLDSPPTAALMKALEQLYALGALNDSGVLTKIGRQMAEFPTDPSVARAIIAAGTLHCARDVIVVVSMLGESSALFLRPRDRRIHADRAREAFIQPSGDMLTLLEIFNQWEAADYSSQWARDNYLQMRSLTRARDVHDQLLKLCDRIEVDTDQTDGDLSSNAHLDTTPILKALTTGLFWNAAQLNRSGDSYKVTRTNQNAYIHPSSVLRGRVHPRWLLFYELVLTSKEFMRNCMIVSPEWLLEVAPHVYKDKIQTEKKMPKAHISR